MKQVIFSTAQILLNELREKRFALADLSLLVFDEAHHTIKNTAYNQLMRDFFWTAGPEARPRVFGMTASPGACDSYFSTLEKIGQLCLNLGATIIMPLDTERELQEHCGEPLLDLRETGYTREEAKTSADMARYLLDLLDILPSETKRQLPRGTATIHNNVYATALYDVVRIAEENNWTDVLELSTHMKASLESWEALIDLGHVYAAGLLTIAVTKFRDRIACGRLEGRTIERWKALVSDHYELKRTLRLAPNGTTIEPEILLQCPKVAELVHVLQTYQDDPTVRMILFTKMRSTAFKLRDTLVSLDHLAKLRHRIGVLVGHGHRSGEHRMKPRHQVEICDKFESGDINLLIATSVAEEGLDIPACNVVIRYDSLDTVTNFVQSRGRARARNSDFFYIFRDRYEEKSMERMQYQEKNMRRAVQEIMNGVISFQNTLEALFSGDARQFVEEDCVQILKQYCMKLSKNHSLQERYMELAPNGSKAKPRYICKLILPEGVGLADRCIVGEARKSLILAKRDACYHACVQLHTLGSLQRAVGADYVLIKQKRAVDGKTHLFRVDGTTSTANIEDLVDNNNRLLYIVNLPVGIAIQAEDIAVWLTNNAARPRIREVSVFPQSQTSTDAALLRGGSYCVIKMVGPGDVTAVLDTVSSLSFDGGQTQSNLVRHRELMGQTDEDSRERVPPALGPRQDNGSLEEQESIGGWGGLDNARKLDLLEEDLEGRTDLRRSKDANFRDRSKSYQREKALEHENDVGGAGGRGWRSVASAPKRRKTNPVAALTPKRVTPPKVTGLRLLRDLKSLASL